MTPSTRKRKPIKLPIVKMIVIFAVSMVILLTVDFGQRAARGYQVRRAEEKLSVQVEALTKAHDALLARLDYVQSDAYIEEVARNELKWSKPGETVVIILATPLASEGSAAAGSLTTLQPAAVQNQTPLEAWLGTFFPK